MYIKFTVDGPLIDIVRKAFPDAPDDALFRDYENVYEWVWLSLPSEKITLNISREHEWGEETRIYPIYVNAWSLDQTERIDDVPRPLINAFAQAHPCPIELFAGQYNVDLPDGKPIEVIG